MLHGKTWAEDVERIARLRAAGWNVLEVAAPLLRRPDELVRRVAAALDAAK
jgi:very-short-patch-repair endonuclease